MEFGICNQSIVPLREKPNHKSQMVSQMLFGEVYSIIQNFEDWLQIKMAHDSYFGWINKKQHLDLSVSEKIKIENNSKSICLELVHPIANKVTHIPIVIGSTLYNFDGLNCMVKKQNWNYNGQALNNNNINVNEELITKVASKFLNAPYLWGGRSPFGIDCSGFTQIVYKIFGVEIPRDSNQQATIGNLITFIKEARTGDLAFFDNDEGTIDHVGLMLNNESIIHASGKVRIDKIDHFGIFNNELNKYSHKLRIIKRIPQLYLK